MVSKSYNPKVSIVTPSYNQGKFLEKTIMSVLDQNYSNIEYIIIDGGSTDNSVDIIRNYEDRIAYWISEPDHGQSHALNKGFYRSTGDILAWLNSDDEYTPSAVYTAVQAFLKYQDVSMVYGNCDIIDEQDNKFNHIRSHQCDLSTLISGNIIPQPSSFFTKKSLQDIGYINESLKYSMDYDIFLKISSKFKIKYLPSTLSRFRFQKESKTISEGDFFWQEVFFVLDNLLFNTYIDRTVSDKTYTQMLKLIIKECPKGQEENAMECLQYIQKENAFDSKAARELINFLDKKSFNRDDYNSIRNSLLLLYQVFRRRYENKSYKLDKNANNWVNEQVIYIANYLFDSGKTTESKQWFRILLENPETLKSMWTFALIRKMIFKKYFLGK